MSLPFTKLKNSAILGLDDQATFGRHFGCTIREIIKDHPGYIEWLNKSKQKFYPSVLEKLNEYKIVKIHKDTQKYLNHKYNSDDFSDMDDYWNDVPF